LPEYVLLTIGIVAGYLLGAIPSGYIAARLTRGIDLRRYGTGGIGLSNVWHSVHSLWIVIPVVILDIVKVMPAVWWASVVGLDLTAQVIIGFCGVIGHNWPVYLRFHGGRGMLCTLGFVFIVPVVNAMVPWPLIVGLSVLFIMLVIIRSSSVAVWLAVSILPIVSIITSDPLPLLLGNIAVFLLMNFRRLVQPRSPLSASLKWRQVLLYRLIFDRDIRNRKEWVKQRPENIVLTGQKGR
jgi:acyl phosphate:glycerol-3-phosphate acyltransferase